VTRGSLGEFCIDFNTYGWFPVVLPGEEGSDSNDDEGGET
jgi:methylated-DNA-protein-cysteine methyltransferase related protein